MLPNPNVTNLLAKSQMGRQPRHARDAGMLSTGRPKSLAAARARLLVALIVLGDVLAIAF